MDTERASASDLRATVVRLLGVLRWISRPPGSARSGNPWLTATELGALFLWTLAVTAPYLNLDPAISPAGGEFLANIQMFHVWNWVRQCGVCALWFGSSNGGWPAAADVNAPILHPLVAVSTLLWGVLNGSKLALVAAFFLAGLAQWWLGRVLRIGRIARLWSACMAVAAGSLASHMSLGSTGMVLSSAAAALVWPPLILLSRTGRRREAVWLGLALGSLLLAGNGYMQVACAFAAPAILLFLPGERRKILSRYLLAAGIALLLAAPVLVPFLHFLPGFSKDFEPGFQWAQPLAYVPLNLVITDFAYYQSNVLGKLPYAYSYALFIGWVPVLLACWGLRDGGDREERRAVLFLAVLVLLSFWIGSAGPLKLIIKALPFRWVISFVGGLRYTGYMAGLAVPPILALAGLGLNKLLAARWPALQLIGKSGTALSVNLRWLLAVPLLLAMLSAKEFGSRWIALWPLPPEQAPVLAALRTPDSQWVSTPFGEDHWVEPAIGSGLKLANNAYLTWHWEGHPSPEPVLAASRQGAPPGMQPRGIVNGIQISATPTGREYAAAVHADGRRTACSARGVGGDIDVVCNLPSPGILTVRENSWSGWKARVAARSLQLLPGQWLAVRLPAGRNVVRFRYRPWDVPLGIFLFLCGVALSVRELARDRREQAEIASANPPGALTET
jgi:hypothetical protein